MYVSFVIANSLTPKGSRDRGRERRERIGEKERDRERNRYEKR